MKPLKDLHNLKGRTALITGGAGHLGKTIAGALAELECNIVLADINAQAVDAVAKDIANSHEVQAHGVAVDLADDSAVHALPHRVVERCGGLSILINNAGFVGTSDLNGWVTDFPQQSTETWRKALEVNLTAPFTLCREAAPYLKDSGHGCIINISSIYGVVGPDMSLYEGTTMGNPAAYATSKGGLIQLTSWLSTVMAPEVRVNAISPGGIRRGQPQAFMDRYDQKTPLGRMATEEDFKGVTAWLASDASKYVTGQNILIDGGWCSW